jgi:hypothetical protein
VSAFRREVKLIFFIKNNVQLLEVCFNKGKKYLTEVIDPYGLNKLVLIQLKKKDCRGIKFKTKND